MSNFPDMYAQTPRAAGPWAEGIHIRHITSAYVTTNICNTFASQIKGSFCGLNMMYHNHSSPGVLQLPWCATTSQWNVV